MGWEYERKYQATEALLRQVYERFPGSWQTIRMHTTYYDTPDGALERMRCTLRCRQENDSCVCTLKTPAESGVRGEWEVPCAQIQQALAPLCDQCGLEALTFLKCTPVVPTCGARFTRMARLLTLPGCTVELALDRGVLTGADAREPLCELEIELKSGSREAADAFADALARELSLKEQPLSKFRRALRLYRGA